MDYRLALLLSVFGFCSPSLYMLRRFHYIDLNMTWYDAQHYCRDKYNDLATIESMSDISRLNRPDISKAWIGLHDDPKAWKTTMGNETNSWKWSSTRVTSKTGYHNWKTNQPDNSNGKQSCVQENHDGTWNDGICDKEWFFICYTATHPANQKTYVVIEKAMNWTNAQTYCRTHYTDLAMIETAEENSEAMSVKGWYTVWIGLYREAWRWSDNKDNSFRNWKETQPDNYNNQHCVMSNEQYQWEDMDCKEELPFWCQEVPKQNILMNLKIQTDADLSDPAINAKLLKQLDDLLRETTGQAHLKLKESWKIQPRKQQQEKERAEDQCPLK